jgi:hypothetical protein
LEVIGELVHVLIVRKKGLSLSTVEVVVPDTDESEDDGQVLFERSFDKVLVHLVSSEEEFVEVVGTDEEHDGETDGGPERVSATDPIPEFEHVVGVDSERSDGLGVGRESDEVLGDVSFL